MIDLRSDTISMPSREMLEEILTAPLGDDGRADAEGRGEDATANRLEDMAAALTGKESAVLFPSGTMGNTAAILTVCRPGDRVLVDEQQHIYLSEKTAFDPRFGKLIPVTYRFDETHAPDLSDLERCFKEGGIRLLCVENTHNFTGGTCLPPERLKAVCELAHSFGAHVHMDGARLFNASVALNVPAGELCRHVDSVMFCISKGLGAPVGSLVCGSREFMKQIRETRKMLGGTMRQAGVIAAPGIYALNHNIIRLKEDHANCRAAAERLKNLKRAKMQDRIDSNILVLDVTAFPMTPAQFCEEAKKRGLLIKPVLKGKVRLVFYMGVDREQSLQAADILLSMDREL